MRAILTHPGLKQLPFILETPEVETASRETSLRRASYGTANKTTRHCPGDVLSYHEMCANENARLCGA
jgi:hypothetical protein